MATIAYLRVSTDEQDLGLDAQDLAIRAKYEPAEVFIDEGLSGGKADRPALMQALSALRKGDELVVAKRDRLSRGNAYLTAWIEKEVAKVGARIVSVAGEGTESDEPQDILMRRIIDAFSEFERLQIGARTKAALAAKKAKGERIGEVPYGFDADADGRLTANVEEQETLTVISALRGRGWTLRAICGELEARGITTKKGAKKWQPKTVANLAKAA
jgi:DNA invertase Pin-like site-specific DNA recombinase